MSAETHVVIDLDALASNVDVVRHAAPNSSIMAVIKADAYGHGVLRIANALTSVDGFAVARLDEAIALRKAGIRKTILVLTGFSTADDVSLFSIHDIDAVIHSDYQLDALNSVYVDKPISVWLKINTGMNRLGVEPSSVGRISRELSLSANVRLPIKSMTHLACADDMVSDVTAQQIAVFDACVGELAGEQSICNSAGLLGWQHAQRHWVRPGIMLYGGAPFTNKAASDDGLLPVMTFKSHITALRTVNKGECVGYGGSWLAERTSLIATVGVGYGDGYPRQAVFGTPVLIGDERAPLVGRVSMDSINIDVSQCAHANIGDEVTLWGTGLPIDEVAEQSGTISYELMCSITNRVKRVMKGVVDGK